jgi:hypothetical protein
MAKILLHRLVFERYLYRQGSLQMPYLCLKKNVFDIDIFS